MNNSKIKSIFSSKKMIIICQFILGGIFIYAGLGKLLHPLEFAENISNYKILPENTEIIAAYILSLSELILGTLLVLNIYSRISAIVLSSLLIVFILAILSTIVRGIEIDCGCFPFLPTSPQSMESKLYLILRDIFLIVPGLIIIFFSPSTNNSE